MLPTIVNATPMQICATATNRLVVTMLPSKTYEKARTKSGSAAFDKTIIKYLSFKNYTDSGFIIIP